MIDRSRERAQPFDGGDPQSKAIQSRKSFDSFNGKRRFGLPNTNDFLLFTFSVPVAVDKRKIHENISNEFCYRVVVVANENLHVLINRLLSFVLGLTCYCDGSCPGNTQNGTCEVRPGGQCFSAVEEVYDDFGQIEAEYSFGCLSPDQAGGLLQVICGNFIRL